jgi:hypothetical protein
MFWPSEAGHRVAIGSPELVAEAVLDATSLVVVAEAVLDTMSLVVEGDWLTMDESVVEVDWLEAVLLCESEAVLDALDTLLELESVIWEAPELIVEEALWLETESDEATLTEDVAVSVEEESVDEELPDAWALDESADEVETAELELDVDETSVDDWMIAWAELEADSEVLLTSVLEAESLAVTVSLEDWTGSDELLVMEAETLAGTLLLETAVALAVLWLTLETAT